MGKPRNIGPEIISLYLSGLSYKQISDKLKISSSTISYHCSSISRYKPKPKPIRRCVCGKQTKNKHYCSRDCWFKDTDKFIPTGPKKVVDRTVEQLKYDKCHRSSAYAQVRAKARSIGKSLGWNSCRLCGYDKHIEICHIKPINTYPPNTLCSEINIPSNLLPLCRNCHWEFDNGLVDSQRIELCLSS